MPSHPATYELKSDEIKTLFLSPNVTLVCQPMDRGVLKFFKKTLSPASEQSDVRDWF